MFFRRLATDKVLRNLPDEPVETYSNNSGSLLHTFENPRAVLAAGYPNVLKVLGTRDNMAYGVRWRFQSEVPTVAPPVSEPPTPPVPPAPKKPVTDLRAIEAIDPLTGRIEFFPSIEAAGKAGFDRDAVRKVLDGRAVKHRKMLWRYWVKPNEDSAIADVPEIANSMLTAAQRRDEIKRLTAAVYLDVNQNLWGVRLENRTIFRPTRQEAVAAWYANQSGQEALGPGVVWEPKVETPVPETPKESALSAFLNTRRPGNKRPIRAVTPEGEVVHEFGQVIDALKAGFGSSGLYQSLKGKGSYQGLNWEYVPA
jgi:hypothetical protein